MIEFRRNKETGILEVWKDGKKTGEIHTMGDDIKKEDYNEGRSSVTLENDMSKENDVSTKGVKNKTEVI